VTRAAGPVVLTALGIEARAVRRGILGIPGATVLCTGIGPRRAARAAARAARWLPAAAPVAVAGFCGAVGDGVRPGDVVVATEVRDEAGAVPLPGWATLVAALRRCQLPVHAGPLLTTARPVLHRRQREALAAAGALAVDMESAAAVRALPGHPTAVLRVVSDTAQAGLASPRLVGNGIAAYRALAAAAPALAEWAAVATESGATDTGATDTGATDTGATDIGATDTGATDSRESTVPREVG
jgi:4-hydroxy-3-methylbut-2-en-1-yl diphosphate reductase